MKSKARGKRTGGQSMSQAKSLPKMEIHPLTPDRWKDFEELFGERGACAGCWCMWWRLKRSEFDRNKGAKNKAAMNKIVRSGQIPGILGYLEGKPVAWCSVGPRETYPTLGRSRVLKRIDDKPVWSVVCLFIAKPFRQKGVSVEMLKGAVEHAKRNGAEIVEGYPVQPKKGSWPDAFLYVGLPSAFKRAGFKEAHRPSRARSIMRYILK
jgi:GNAT superfamily N-acetyltransferase